MTRHRIHQQMQVQEPRTANGSPISASAYAEALPAATVQTLTEFTEELGRLMARRQLAALRDRRLGYGLVDIMLGVVLMAAVSLLLHRVLG